VDSVHLIGDSLVACVLHGVWVYLQTPDCGLGSDERLDGQKENLKREENIGLRKHLPV
jgi:hypothetical protein